MIVISFISALIVGAIVFKLGAYVTIISIVSTGSKVILALMAVAVLILLYRKFRRTPKLLRLPWLSDK